jgi:hypothetical protein
VANAVRSCPKHTLTVGSCRVSASCSTPFLIAVSFIFRRQLAFCRAHLTGFRADARAHTHARTHATTVRYLPIAVSVAEGFRQRWTQINNATGKIDHWPSQALETYQCPDPTSREHCPTDASTDIAGLMAVLPRLIALPSSVVTPAQVSLLGASNDTTFSFCTITHPPTISQNERSHPLTHGTTS